MKSLEKISLFLLYFYQISQSDAGQPAVLHAAHHPLVSLLSLESALIAEYFAHA